MSEYASSAPETRSRADESILSTATVRRVATMGAIAGAYYGSARLGYALGFSGPVAAIVWLPVGVGIAGLYLGGIGLWPGVLVGDLLANDYSALPLGSAVAQTCGNVAEVVLATILLRRLVRRGSPLESVAGVGSIVAAIAAGTALSATVGVASARLGGVVSTASMPNVWRTWWLGDSSGALVVVPLALAWRLHSRRGRHHGGSVEAVLLLVATATLSALAFQSSQPLMYLVFPALVWGALRFGQRGATATVVVSVPFAVWSVVHHTGAFHFESITRSVLNAQLYIAVATLSTLCLAAVVTEREEVSERLATARAQVFAAGEAERHRLERNLHDGAQQLLSALAITLDVAAERTRTAPEEAPALFLRAEAGVSEALDELRALVQGLHPAVLTELGLARAIRSVAARSPVPITVHELPSARLDPLAETTAYYVVAEAVANAQKHARATTIHVTVRHNASSLAIVVADDGIGDATEDAGTGLAGLRERVAALDGMFTLESPHGGGTRIAAVIPVAAA